METLGQTPRTMNVTQDMTTRWHHYHVLRLGTVNNGSMISGQEAEKVSLVPWRGAQLSVTPSLGCRDTAAGAPVPAFPLGPCQNSVPSSSLWSTCVIWGLISARESLPQVILCDPRVNSAPKSLPLVIPCDQGWSSYAFKSHSTCCSLPQVCSVWKMPPR